MSLLRHVHIFLIDELQIMSTGNLLLFLHLNPNTHPSYIMYHFLKDNCYTNARDDRNSSMWNTNVEWKLNPRELKY